MDLVQRRQHIQRQREGHEILRVITGGQAEAVENCVNGPLEEINLEGALSYRRQGGMGEEL